MTPFRCTRCGNTVYFENTDCGQCGAVLGFVPGTRRMTSFEFDQNADADASPAWLRLGPEGSDGFRLRPCANRIDHGVCNWMLDDGDTRSLCLSCRLTQLIPSLDNPANLQHWAAIERAKRRLMFSLLGIGLAPRLKGTGADEDTRGLVFHLLENLPGGPAVITGHEDGVITLNIAEADDVFREAARVSMHEPTRTLLGHLRHEVSHYLEWRHIESTPAIERCRETFGDERVDYSAALQTHYTQGAPANWPGQYVSAYASCHPYEDWAETCAHYLLVIDALQTASAWGLQLDGPASTRAADADAPGLPVAHLVLEHWLPLAQFLNAMNRSLGQPDAYPFLLPPQVLAKMNLVQAVLADASQAPGADAVPGPAPDPVTAPSADPMVAVPALP